MPDAFETPVAFIIFNRPNAETRGLVESMIDWPCEVYRNYAEHNNGCGKRVPIGLEWVFESEDSAFIMEDDIYVDSSFLLFCEAMLDRYGDHEEIMQVSVYNRMNMAPLDGSFFYEDTQ
jgi:hypothetical protein